MITAPASVRGYAVVIPKKVIKGAVGRHMLKRRVLAALRALSLPESLVVFPKASAEKLSLSEVQTELKQLVSKMTK